MLLKNHIPITKITTTAVHHAHKPGNVHKTIEISLYLSRHPAAALRKKLFQYMKKNAYLCKINNTIYKMNISLIANCKLLKTTKLGGAANDLTSELKYNTLIDRLIS